MGKQLSEMKLEELWELFPIILSPHKECWKEWYQEEAIRIKTFLPVDDVKVSHIGSTAIENIWAKPIIDILLEIPKTVSMEEIKKTLTDNGYICMSESSGRKSFNKGYTDKGFADKVFHLHLRFLGDDDEVYFRDYLNANPVIANEYEVLKLTLWKKYEHNRDAYTDAKTEFVKKYTQEAKSKQKTHSSSFGAAHIMLCSLMATEIMGKLF